MNIIEINDPQCRYWVVDSWHQEGLLHAFVGRDMDISCSHEKWQNVFSESKQQRKLHLLEQTHSADIVNFSAEKKDQSPGDAWLVAPEQSSSKVENCFGVFSADCIPVLLYERRLGFVAALHCGWRGAVAGLLPKVITQLKDLGASSSDVEIAIGPGASSCCYQIGSEVAEKFFAASKEDQNQLVVSREGKMFGDIKRLLELQATQSGLNKAQIATSSLCTICSDTFFSFRREKGLLGRQVSFISSSLLRRNT